MNNFDPQAHAARLRTDIDATTYSASVKTSIKAVINSLVFTSEDTRASLESFGQQYAQGVPGLRYSTVGEELFGDPDTIDYYLHAPNLLQISRNISKFIDNRRKWINQRQQGLMPATTFLIADMKQDAVRNAWIAVLTKDPAAGRTADLRMTAFVTAVLAPAGSIAISIVHTASERENVAGMLSIRMFSPRMLGATCALMATYASSGIMGAMVTGAVGRSHISRAVPGLLKQTGLNRVLENARVVDQDPGDQAPAQTAGRTIVQLEFLTSVQGPHDYLPQRDYYLEIVGEYRGAELDLLTNIVKYMGVCMSGGYWVDLLDPDMQNGALKVHIFQAVRCLMAVAGPTGVSPMMRQLTDIARRSAGWSNMTTARFEAITALIPQMKTIGVRLAPRQVGQAALPADWSNAVTAAFTLAQQ